ncbi:MAG: metallophosphoesterase [Endomicrobiales bacterium]
MKRTTAGLSLLLLLGLAFFWHVETNDVAVTVCRVNDPELAELLGSARVVQISDLHVRRQGLRERNLARVINRVDPDLVLVTGDNMAGSRGIEPCAALLHEIGKGRTVVATLGNNDHSYQRHFNDTERLVAELKKAGVRVLVNESLKLTVERGGRSGGKPLYIVGLDDNFLWYDDFFKATRNVPKDAPKLVLAHAPNIIEKIDTRRVKLILSGHTHGGQVVVPFLGAVYLNPTFRARKRFVSGLYRDDTLLYVSRGIGTVLLPVRLFCKPEVTLFEFVP